MTSTEHDPEWLVASEQRTYQVVPGASPGSPNPALTVWIRSDRGPRRGLLGAVMTSPPVGSDDLDARQAALQAEAAAILAELDLQTSLADVGTVLLAGSYVSGLMSWPDLDVMVCAGPEFAPSDVLRLLQRFVDRPGVVGFDYRDERGPRSPTGTVRDERYHVVINLVHSDRRWRIDLTIWLNDPHQNITAWHEALRGTVTAEQRSAILSIKDVWHRLPSYPDRVGGWEIYNAVLDDGIRSPQQFDAWLAAHGYPQG